MTGNIKKQLIQKQETIKNSVDKFKNQEASVEDMLQKYDAQLSQMDMMEANVMEQIKRIGANLDGESPAYQRILDS